MIGIDNDRVEEESGVHPEELKEAFRAIVLDIESEGNAGNVGFEVEPEDFDAALTAVTNIPIADSAAVAAEHTIRAKKELSIVLNQMENDAYAGVLETDVLQSLEDLEDCYVAYTNYYGEDAIDAN